MSSTSNPMWTNKGTKRPPHAEEPAHGKASVWGYPRPQYIRIANFVSFYPVRVSCTVDGQQARAQPGGFYGGWITEDIVGPFKGEPGTGYW